MTASLFRNELENNKAVSGSLFATEIKEFAVSLHLYSPKVLLSIVHSRRLSASWQQAQSKACKIAEP